MRRMYSVKFAYSFWPEEVYGITHFQKDVGFNNRISWCTWICFPSIALLSQWVIFIQVIILNWCVHKTHGNITSLTGPKYCSHDTIWLAVDWHSLRACHEHLLYFTWLMTEHVDLFISYICISKYKDNSYILFSNYKLFYFLHAIDFFGISL